MLQHTLPELWRSLSPAIVTHALAAGYSLLCGLALLSLRKGTPLHRVLGGSWVGAMLVTALLFWFFTYEDKSHRVASSVSLGEQLKTLKDPRVWRYCQYYSIVFGGYVALALWMTKYYVQEYGFSLQSAALLAADIEEFRFHDLRHTTASYLAMNGASLLSISKVLGHQTTKMTERYSHLATSHIDEVVRSMNAKKFGPANKPTPTTGTNES